MGRIGRIGLMAVAAAMLLACRAHAVVVCFFETEQDAAKAADPVWKGPHTAAMATISMMAGPAQYAGDDPSWLDARIDAAAAHLLAQAEGMRGLNLGGWWGNREFGAYSWGGVTYTPDYTVPPSAERLKRYAAYIVRRLESKGVKKLDLLFTDHEVPYKHADGVSVRSNDQSFRAAWLRETVKPFTDAFGCEYLNFAFATPSPSIPTVGWWGGPLGSGTPCGTSSVDAYLMSWTDSKTGVRQRLNNVRSCLAAGEKVVPHLPALVEHKGWTQTAEQATAQMRAYVHGCASLGVKRFVCATYMWPAAQQPALAANVKAILAEAQAVEK